MPKLSAETLINAVATIYTARLKRRLTRLELSAVASGQSVPNDFYDANMCLSAAFETVYGREPFGNNQDNSDCDILNAAMDITHTQLEMETRS